MRIHHTVNGKINAGLNIAFLQILNLRIVEAIVGNISTYSECGTVN